MLLGVSFLKFLEFRLSSIHLFPMTPPLMSWFLTLLPFLVDPFVITISACQLSYILHLNSWSSRYYIDSLKNVSIHSKTFQQIKNPDLAEAIVAFGLVTGSCNSTFQELLNKNQFIHSKKEKCSLNFQNIFLYHKDFVDFVQTQEGLTPAPEGYTNNHINLKEILQNRRNELSFLFPIKVWAV